MEYEIVDRYPRQGQFDFYKEHPSPFYAVTWTAEISDLKASAARRGHSTFMALCGRALGELVEAAARQYARPD